MHPSAAGLDMNLEPNGITECAQSIGLRQADGKFFQATARRRIIRRVRTILPVDKKWQAQAERVMRHKKQTPGQLDTIGSSPRHRNDLMLIARSGCRSHHRLKILRCRGPGPDERLLCHPQLIPQRTVDRLSRIGGNDFKVLGIAKGHQRVARATSRVTATPGGADSAQILDVFDTRMEIIRYKHNMIKFHSALPSVFPCMQTRHTRIIALPTEKASQLELAAVLAAAFAKDPLMRKMLGDDKWSTIKAPYFQLQLAQADHAIALADAGQFIGVLLARSPAARMPGWRSALQALKARKLLGNKFVLSQQMARAISAKVPKEPHWYINQIGTLPAARGLGVGHAMLATLAQMRGRDPVYVDCERPLTGFYQRAGYELVAATSDQQMVVMGLR